MAHLRLKLIVPAIAAVALAYGAYYMFAAGDQIFALLLVGLALMSAWFASEGIRQWWYGLNDPLY